MVALKPGHSEHVSSRHGRALQKEDVAIILSVFTRRFCVRRLNAAPRFTALYAKSSIAKYLETAADKNPRGDLRCIILETSGARRETVRARPRVLIETLNMR